VTATFIGIDVGTSACKAVLVDAAGRELASATSGYPTRRRADGEVTQDARHWLHAVREVLRALAGQASGIEGIGVTAPAHYPVLLGGGRPLTRVIIASDRRPAPTAARMAEALGPAYFAATRMTLNSTLTLPQLAWLRAEQPRLWDDLDGVLVAKDYVRFALTGVRATDPSDAAGTGMFDQRAGAWDPELAAEAGLRVEQLPEILPATAIGGRLSARVARDVGLPSGIPLAVSATDTAAELVSVGAVAPRSGIVKIASTGVVVATTDRLGDDPALLNYPHAATGLFYAAAVTNTAATAYSWIAGVLDDGLGALDRLAARAPAGSDGVLFLPFLEGRRTPRWDPNARGALLGLSSAHGREHLARAVLEGVALSLRASWEDVAASVGAIERPSLTGGGARSRLWRDILVSALGRTASFAVRSGPALGAALIARSAARGEPEIAIPRSRGRTVEPIDAWQPVYERSYRAFRAAADSA
jgi:xylulokinase